MQQENILDYAIAIQTPNTSRSFSEQHGEAYMRVLVNFLVSWHKQCLEPSLVCPSWDHRSELDQWQFHGNWVITRSPNTHRVCSHISNRKEKQVSFFLSHFYSERELFWVFPELPPGWARPDHWRERECAVACLLWFQQSELQFPHLLK